MAILLGYDIGSSSIKASLLDGDSGRLLATATSPKKELRIKSVQPGWAEQDPRMWWEHVLAATAEIKEKTGDSLPRVGAVGISYQMHGLILVDKNQEPLRDAIIWCDSRAVQIGDKAAEDIGSQRCFRSMLNLPGNFTASKLAWVKRNEPRIYAKAAKMMLPGDYIAMRLTGETTTTLSGLSEGIMWDFNKESPADLLMNYYEIDQGLLCRLVPAIGMQGQVTPQAAAQLGLETGTPVTYRAGDQPNNALSLRVLEPGQAAVTAGTSAVVYCVTDRPVRDEKSRVNLFAHVNHGKTTPRYGVLLCVNGSGILNSWLKHNFSNGGSLDYPEMNELAAGVSTGCDGLVILPFGNGAERTLNNLDLGAAVSGWNFNIHGRKHLFRAAQEGIVFALNYGLEIVRLMGVEISTVRAGRANMFLSKLFAEAFANTTGTRVELYDTDGSQGAARAAGFGAGLYESLEQAYVGLQPADRIEPDTQISDQYQRSYNRWRKVLDRHINSIASP